MRLVIMVSLKMLLWRPAVPYEICISSYAFDTVAVLGGTTSI